MTRKTIPITIIVLAALLVSGVLLSQFNFSRLKRLGHRTNSSSTAALNDVRTIGVMASVWADESSEQRFRFTALTDAQREDLKWIRPRGDARYLVTLQPLQAWEQLDWEAANSRVIAVCDTPYRPSPGPWFGVARPNHAAVYESGRTALISIDEFAALDVTQFRPLGELAPLEE
ncbi:MAG: hypothetical protein AAF581_08890 [Planctomycetota bacterium]